MKSLALAMVSGIALAVSTVALAQEAGPPPVAAAQQQFKIDFPGGTPQEFAAALQEAIGIYVVASPALTREMRAMKLQEDDLRGFMADVMRMGFLVLLRGYVILPPDAQAQGEVKERALTERELERVQPLVIDQAKPVDFLAKFSELVSVPVVLQSELPDKPFDVRLGGERIHEVFEKFAALMKVQARRVYIVGDADEATMRQYLAGMSNAELYDYTKQGLTRAGRFTSEQRIGFMNMAYQFFQGLPAQQRLGAVAIATGMIHLSFQRLAQLNPAQQAELRQLGQPLLDDLAKWFNSLPPQGRSELRPIISAIEEGLGEKVL